MPDTDTIREALVDELNIGDLPPEEQEELIEELGALALKRALIDIYSLLPENYHDEFDKLVQANDQEKVLDFLKTHIPNIQTIVGEAIAKTIAEHKKILLEMESKEGAATQ